MDTKLSLKLLIDTNSNRVLFAEAGKEVVDFLFGLLALPIGTIINLLSKEQMVGCIGDLHSSLEQLEETYVLSSSKKTALLNPPVFSTPISKDTLLLPPSPFTDKKIFYCCSHCSGNYLTDVHRSGCPGCRYEMQTQMKYVVNNKQEERGELGFVKGVVTYSIMDDLSVVPMSAISSITLINKFHIKDLALLKEKNVKLGMEEGLELLKVSLESRNALTTVFLAKNKAK